MGLSINEMRGGVAELKRVNFRVKTHSSVKDIFVTPVQADHHS